MALPSDTTPEAIRAAAREFDTNPGAYAPATRYAVLIDGKPYPPKAIISLATRLPTSMFSGGAESNRWLARRGFVIQALDNPTRRK